MKTKDYINKLKAEKHYLKNKIDTLYDKKEKDIFIEKYDFINNFIILIEEKYNKYLEEKNKNNLRLEP